MIAAGAAGGRSPVGCAAHPGGAGPPQAAGGRRGFPAARCGGRVGPPDFPAAAAYLY